MLPLVAPCRLGAFLPSNEEPARKRRSTTADHCLLKSEPGKTTGVRIEKERREVMNEKNAFERKMRADLVSVQNGFFEFKAQAKHYKIDNHIKQHVKNVEDLERKLNNAKAGLQGLEVADDGSWEPLREGMEKTWTDLQSTLENYTFQAKINSELELVQARFVEFKAQAHHLKDETQRQEHAKHVEELERKVNAAKAKMRELAEADDDALDMVKDGVENVWTELQSTLEDTITTFKDK